MQYVGRIATCIAGVLVVAALVATSASAFPAYYECAKLSKNPETNKFEAKYLDKYCSVEASESQREEGKKNKFELLEGVGTGKEIKTKGEQFTLHTVVPGRGDIKVECAQMKGTGYDQDVGGRGITTDAWWYFKKCTALGERCQSPGAKAGEIRSGPLVYNLGSWEYEEKYGWGDVYKPEKPKEWPYLIEAQCGVLGAIRVAGSAIFNIEGRNAISKTQTNVFAVGPYLGEVELGYTPLVNFPTNFVGEEVAYLRAEFNTPETEGTWQPEGGLPAGIEGVAVEKGDKLEIR